MLRKYVAPVIALLITFGTASAQNYHIRVSFNTNLRSSPSLQADIVKTVRSGKTLQVVGQQGRWLRIGQGAREMWMANWVRYTRVESADPTQSDVDNCCFVDRQCNSDQEWTNGYWAYQNNQCGAPSQTQSQTSVPPTTSQPGAVDNCCNVDRHCSSDQDWVNGFYAYQNQQCLVPGQFDNRHGVIIEGGAGFISQMEDSLETLRTRAPHWYDYTISGLNRIVQRLSSDNPGMHVDSKTFYLDYTDEYPAGFDPWLHISNSAAMLAHEACHAHRHYAGLESGGYPGEKACLGVNIEVLKAVNAPGHWIAIYQRLLDNIDDPANQWWLPGNY